MAAGGDGTVAWVLKTIRELALEPPPLVAVMPLGTGNDLSLSFGWGNTFLPIWIKVMHFPNLAGGHYSDSNCLALALYGIILGGLDAMIPINNLQH